MVKRKQIRLAFDGPRGEQSRHVDALVLTPRIAVHRRVNFSGADCGGFSVSDPKTGRMYCGPFTTESEAEQWAQGLIERFGADPIQNGRLNKRSNSWKVQPPRFAELREYALARLGRMA